MNYFNELQERIREIRISERFFYQKIKDGTEAGTYFLKVSSGDSTTIQKVIVAR
jgi:hypothetical protein